MTKIICECNEVRQDEIIRAIKEFKLNSVSQVSKMTGASTSCGRCRRIIRRLINDLSVSDN